MKSAEEVIKEIDDLIEDSDAEEDDLSEHGNQVMPFETQHQMTVPVVLSCWMFGERPEN